MGVENPILKWKLFHALATISNLGGSDKFFGGELVSTPFTD
jgi:hypothetical protein